MNLQQAVTHKKRPSQTDILRNHFDSGQRLTVAEALTKYGIYALSQRCGDLRKDGYPLADRLIKLKSGKWVKEYRRK